MIVIALLVLFAVACIGLLVITHSIFLADLFGAGDGAGEGAGDCVDDCAQITRRAA